MIPQSILKRQTETERSPGSINFTKGMVTVMEITRETIIGDILDIAPETAPFFFEIGMHCLGCPASRGETVEMACAVHGVDCDELLTKINTFLKNK